MSDNPWAGIQNLGAIDQKLYQPQKEVVEPVLPSPTPAVTQKTKSVKHTSKVEKKLVSSKVEIKPERKERQLNAWITASQNDTLDRLYFRLRAQGVKLKKGELVGVGIEVLSKILEQYNPKTIDSTLLDNFLIRLDEKKQKK